MKKIILVLCFLFSFQFVTFSDNHYIEKIGVSLLKPIDNNVEGFIEISGKTTHKKIEILVEKEKNKISYDVDLIDGNFYKKIWLIDGKGDYKISIMVHIKDRLFYYGPSITVKNNYEPNKYLVPTKHVESDNEDIIKLAEQITKNKKTELEKSKEIYNWIVKNIKYDYDKREKILLKDYSTKNGALYALEQKKGVCYDYATLFAALNRSIGIQTKIIKGTGIDGKISELHAWNEVYISKEDKWIPVDTTFGATSKRDYFNNKNFYKDHIKNSEY